MQIKSKVTVSRRSLIRGVSATAMGGGFVLASASSGFAAQRVQNVSHEVNLRVPHPRVVAYQGGTGMPNGSFSVVQAVDWVASQVGVVDLIAFDAVTHAVSTDDIAALSAKAVAQLCYIAVGMRASSDLAPYPALVAPDGKVVTPSPGSTIAVYDTDIGRLALTSNATPAIENINSDLDLIIHSGSHDFGAEGAGGYVIDVIASDTHAARGSAIYAPDGRVMTRTGPGWTQGLIATLDIAGLRRERQLERRAAIAA